VCQQNYLLSTSEDPHCHSCKRGWSTEFVADKFPISFRKGTLRKHRQKILMDREMSFLPAMQIFVEAFSNKIRYQGLLSDILIPMREAEQKWLVKRRAFWEFERVTYTPITLLKAQGKIVTDAQKAEVSKVKAEWRRLKLEERDCYTNEFTPARNAFQTVRDELARWTRIYDDGTDTDLGGEKTKREFMMRCPQTDCRGFLSTAYKCGVCQKNTCSECLEALPETLEGAEAPQHTCNPDSVESAKAIKKETRPCPRCAARIFKIDGCDQMWCIVEGCNTTFSWNTGHIVTGRTHNPHYYEWLRRNGGGEAPREIGDIPCGGIPTAHWWTRRILQCSLTTQQKNALLEIHRNVVDFEARLPSYPARPPTTMNKSINVSYLMNKITEADWQMKLEHNEARFNRKKEIGQLLQTLVTAAADIMQTIAGEFEKVANGTIEEREATNSIVETWLPNLEALRNYTNESYKKMGDSLRMAVPYINEKWQWTGIHVNHEKNEIMENPENGQETVPT